MQYQSITFHRILTFIPTLLILSSLSTYAHATQPAWSLVADESKVAFVSIKKNTIGESNHFTSLSGHIATTGEVSIQIDLTSVETHIGIRNQRLIKHLFGGDGASALLHTMLDMKTLDQLAMGETKQIAVKGHLRFLDKVMNINTNIIAARLSEQRLLVISDEMIILNTKTLGVNAGVDKLAELAGLSSIARAVPVTLRMVFEKK